MAPHNTDQWRNVLALVDDRIKGHPGNVLAVVTSWPADKTEGTCKVWGAKGSATIRIAQNILTEITFSGIKYMKNHIVTQTSVAHHTRTGHPALWTKLKPSGVDTNCDCTISQIQEDHPTNPVTEHEHAFRPPDATERENLEKLRDEVAEQHGVIKNLEEKLGLKQAEIETVKLQKLEVQRAIEQLETNLNDSQRTIATLNESRRALQNMQSEKDKLINRNRAELAQKTKALSELEALNNSVKKRARDLLFDLDGVEVLGECPASKKRHGCRWRKNKRFARASTAA